MVEPGEGGDGLSVADDFRVRAVRALHPHLEIDDVGASGTRLVVSEAEAVERAGGKVARDDVALRDHPDQSQDLLKCRTEANDVLVHRGA